MRSKLSLRCAPCRPSVRGFEGPPGEIRQLTQLSDRGFLNHFDITPDGKHFVFDRSRQNSDVVLIDLPKK